MKAADFLRGEGQEEHPRKARDFLHQPAAPAPAPKQSAAAFLRGDPVQAVPRDSPPGDSTTASPAAPHPPPARAGADALDRGVRPDLSLTARPPVLIPPAAEVSQEAPPPVEPPASLIPEFLRKLLPQPDIAPPPELVPPEQPRLPERVLEDIQAGREGMTQAELAGLMAAFERPDALTDPEAARAALALRLAPEQLQGIDDAMMVREILAGLPEDSAMVPGGPGTETFLEGLVRGATMNMVDPSLPVEGEGGEIERLLRLTGRAQEQAAGERRGEYWGADLGGEALGSVLPFATGVRLLRGLRTARGLPAVEEGTAGVVKEGAQVGGPLAAAYRPEGADQMSTEEELTARALQGGIGVVAGGILDFSVMKVAEWGGLARRALADRRLVKEATDKGFDSPEEYLASLVEFERTPEGVVVRPRPAALRALPGERDPLPEPSLPGELLEPNTPPVSEASPTPRTEPGATEGASTEPLALPEPTPAPESDRSPAARRVQADEYDRLARATTDPAIRQELLRQAQTLRTEAEGAQPKLTPQERAKRARRIDTETDDIVTAIRKLGGLNVAIETDWAGRLSHLPRKGFGLPGIEQVRGGGRLLDDLAEALYELGYLSRRDLSELEEKLARAETGEDVFSINKQDFEEPARPPTSSTDADWTYGEVDDVRALDQDFVIDTDNGTVIPSRPFDADDWARLREEEDHARKFFEAEGAADVEPRGDGAPGVPARLADQVQGRDGPEPEPGGTFGLPGVEHRSSGRQALADLERAQDLRRNGARDVAPDEGAGDLFSGRARQRDLIGEPLPGERGSADLPPGRRPTTVRQDEPTGQLDILFDDSVAPAARQAARDEALQVIGPRVRHVETGSFPAGTRRATTPDEVAHIAAPLRREAQESFLAVMTDQHGKVLRIARLHKGQRDQASVDPGLIAGAAANTPGARRVWFVHNHPSGNARQSAPDADMTNHLHSLMRGSGVEPQGMVVVAPGGRYTHYRPDDVTPSAGSALGDGAPPAGRQRRIPAAPRNERLPVTERVLRGQAKGAPIATPEQARKALERMAPDREGLLLLDSQRRPVGFLPMSAADMARLRQGADGPGQRLLAALDETNASGIIAKTDQVAPDGPRPGPDAAPAWAGDNLERFAQSHGTQLFDVLDGAGASMREQGRMVDEPGIEFHANPFLQAFADTAREAVRYPGRTGAQAFAGGTAGATMSDEEIGSPLWWLDVARGATLGIAGFQAARRTGLLGKGSLVDNARVRLGEAIERLPFFGRGPADLQELKRKQRVMRQLMDRQTEAVGRELLARFTPEERAIMADLIESRGIVQDFNIVHRQAQALDDFITDAAERMKGLGMLPEDLETGGYLHRYYAKHLGLGDKLFRLAKSQTLSGSYTIARGTDGVFERNYLSPGARSLAGEMDGLTARITELERELTQWERRAERGRHKNPDLFLEKFEERAAEIRTELGDLRSQRRELGKTELVEYTGLQEGALRSFLFARDEVPRADPGFDPRFAQKDRPDAKPGDLAPQRLPEAPGVEDLTPTGRTWSLRGTDGERVMLHRDWTKAERQAWGEIEDAGYRYVRGMSEVAHDMSLATLYSTVARRSDWVRSLEGAADVVVDGQKWIYVPDAKVNKASPLRKHGELAGKHVRADVWNGIRNYGRPAFAPGPLGTLYRQAVSKWKLYKTVYNPVTHLNNTYSNFEMLYMADYKARDLGRALNTMRKGEADASWREARDAGLFGTDWTTSLVNVDGGDSQVLADLAEQLRTQPDIPDAALSTSIFMDVKEWWINSRNAVRDAPTKLGTGAEVARALSAPVVKGAKFINRPVKAAARGAQRLYRFEDEVFKLAVYQAERARGSSPEEAVQAAQRFFFDYSDMPDGMKLIRDLPIGAPFISYTYFAVQAIARNVAQNPEKVLALAAAYEAWNYAALEATSDGMGPGEYWGIESDIETVAPPWERGRALWGARNTVMLPSPEGYRLALGRSHALGNPFMSEAGGREILPTAPYLTNFWGSSIFGGNPLHAILDLMVNEDWKGKQIYQPGDTTDAKAAKMAAYLYQAWAPSNLLTPGGYHQSRVLEGMANDVRQAREEGEPDGLIAPIVDLANQASEALGFGQFTGLDRADNEINTRDALLGSFGVKLRPMRFSQSVDFELSSLEREIKIHDEVLRRAAREAGANRITDAQFERTRDKQFGEIDQLLDRQEELTGAADRLEKKGLMR